MNAEATRRAYEPRGYPTGRRRHLQAIAVLSAPASAGLAGRLGKFAQPLIDFGARGVRPRHDEDRRSAEFAAHDQAVPHDSAEQHLRCLLEGEDDEPWRCRLDLLAKEPSAVLELRRTHLRRLCCRPLDDVGEADPVLEREIVLPARRHWEKPCFAQPLIEPLTEPSLVVVARADARRR